MRPSKMPQSGPAAEAERGVVAMRAAVAMAALRAALLLELEDWWYSSEERFSGSKDSNSVASNSLSNAERLVEPRVERLEVGVVKAPALAARAARRVARIMVV